MLRLDDISPATGEWECMECGYIEDGSRSRRPRTCPECGAPADAFDFFAYDGSDEAGWDADSLTDIANEEDADDENFEDEDTY